MALQYCWERGYRKIIIESDCKQAIEILNEKALHFASYNWKREIRWWAENIKDITFQWINREANKVADVLARSQTSAMSIYFFHNYVHVTITNLLHEDYIQVRNY